VYTIPGPDFAVPSAQLWLDMARVLAGGELPPHLLAPCLSFAVAAAAVPVLEATVPEWEPYLPSGSFRSHESHSFLAVAFGIGMYLNAYWTIPRFIGALIALMWRKRAPRSHATYMIVAASGLVLGEGLLSIAVALLTSQAVPLWSCAGCTPSSCPSVCYPTNSSGH
jgi:hypothetical protein